MSNLYAISMEAQEIKDNETKLEIAKACEELALKYGLPYREVLKRAKKVVNNRAATHE